MHICSAQYLYARADTHTRNHRHLRMYISLLLSMYNYMYACMILCHSNTRIDTQLQIFPLSLPYILNAQLHESKHVAKTL